MVSEKVQDPNPTGQLHPRLDLHCRADSEPAAGELGPHGSDGFGGHRGEGLLGYHGSDSLGSRQGEGLDGEGGGHVLGLAGVDLAGGDEHEADLGAGVEELESTVVVGEDGAVGVSDGCVLGEGKGGGAVGDGE